MVNQVVECVFLGKKILERRVTRQSRLVEEPNVPSRAKCTESAFLVAASDGHGLHRRVITPLQQQGRQLAHHAQGQGIEGARSIQGNQPYTVLNVGQDIAHRGCSSSLR